MNVFTGIKSALFVGAAVFAFSTFSACELTVDLEPLDNQQCPTGQKGCGGKCVSVKLPAYGCGAPLSCTPCGTANATASCNTLGQCIIGSCQADFKDCDQQNEDGCEVNIRNGDTNNCGDCRVKCDTVQHGSPSCSEKKCVIGKCDDGWEDCDHDGKISCETDLSQPDNCGACGNKCPSDMPNCVNRKCSP